MFNYRCYLLDWHGVVTATEDFDCAGEAEALATARRLRAERRAAGLELWQRPRLVHSERTEPEAAEPLVTHLR